MRAAVVAGDGSVEEALDGGPGAAGDGGPGARRARSRRGSRTSSARARAASPSSTTAASARSCAASPPPARAVTVYPHDARRRTMLARPRRRPALERPRRPEPRCEDEVAAVRELLGRVPVLGICLGHQLLGARGRLRDVQAAVRPPRREPSGAGARDRPRARHEPEPRLRGGAERRRARRPTSRSTTGRSRGSRCPRAARPLGAVPPRGRARARTTPGRSSSAGCEEVRRCRRRPDLRRSA